MARGSRCAGFDSGRGRFAAPLFLNRFVVPLKGSFPLKRRSCYQGRTQHSGYSRLGEAHEGWSKKWKELAALKESIKAQGSEHVLVQACRLFVSENWLVIAGAAWRHYQKNGEERGAVVLPLNAVRTFLNEEEPEKISIGYFTYVDHDGISSAMAGYDPKLSVVSLFADDTTGSDRGRLLSDMVYVVSSHDPPPPEAARRTSN